MKAARYSDSQIMAILKQAEAGSKVYGVGTLLFNILSNSLHSVLDLGGWNL